MEVADRLAWMFGMRMQFMESLNKKVPGSYPACPVEISEKESQQILREMTLRGVEELFEALQHLKNWKTHRTDLSDEFDREEFLEEFVDSLNYFLSVLIMAGVDDKELFKAYVDKHNKILKRLS
jgi:NTP pyrophosphatase (non-canonical NTP hydrolase)